MTQFIKVDIVAKDGTRSVELLNVREIGRVGIADQNSQAKCVVYLRSLIALNVTQSFTWFESQLKARAST